MYAPADFGVLAAFSSILSVFSIIATLRFEDAIPIPEDDETAFGLAKLSLLVAISLGAAAGLGVGLWGDEIARLIDGESV